MQPNDLNERTCIDLFTGLGCFSIAAWANGVRTVAMCECKPDCRNFLAANWPGAEIHPDAKTFDATQYRGVWLVCGGPPCQPASLAGKRRGAADDRWLWPAAIRIVGEARPTWFLFENPPGINGVGLDGVLSDLEGQGYEVGTLNIPACAVDSPQRRERLWIVGHAKGERSSETRRLQRNGHSERIASANQNPSQSWTLGDTESRGFTANGRASRDFGHANEAGENRALGDAKRPEVQRIRELGELGGPPADTAGTWNQRERIRCPDWSNGEAGALAGTHDERFNRALQSNQQTDQGRGDADDGMQGGLWSDHVWIECGDGKRRRAKPGVCGLVNGPSVGLLEALGNAIVWPVAARIIGAMIQAEC